MLSVRVVWLDCLQRFMNAGAKYEAVNRGSLLERREAISADRDTDSAPSAVPVSGPAGRASWTGLRAALRRRNSRKATRSRTSAPATPPTTPPAIFPLVWLSSEPDPPAATSVDVGAAVVVVLVATPPPLPHSSPVEDQDVGALSVLVNTTITELVVDEEVVL